LLHVCVADLTERGNEACDPESRKERSAADSAGR